MGQGSLINGRLYFSTVFLSMAEVVAPESSKIKTCCNFSGRDTVDIDPAIEKAVGSGAFREASWIGGLGSARSFRVPKLLLDPQGRLTYPLGTANSREHLHLQSCSSWTAQFVN